MHILKLLNEKKSIIILVCVILSLAFISTAYIVNIRTLLQKDTEILLQQTIEQNAMHIGERIEEEFFFLELTANSLIKNPEDTFLKHKEKLTMFKEVRNYIEIGIADEQGNIIQLDGTSSNIKDREYFQEALKGKKSVSNPIISRTDNIPVIAFAVPIWENEVVDKVMVATQRIDIFKDYINVELFNNKGHTYILNEKNQVVFCTRVEDEKHVRQHINNPDNIESYCKNYEWNPKRKDYWVSIPIHQIPKWRMEYVVSREKVSNNSKNVIYLSSIMMIGISILIEGILIYVLINNIKNKEKVYQLIYISRKTKIYNKEKLIKVAKEKLDLNPQERYTMIYLVIDNFSVYRDMLGTTKSDIIIKYVADKLILALAGKDVIYAHLASEHFALMVNNQDKDKIIEVLKHINMHLQDLTIGEYKNIKITLSAGIYFLPIGEVGIEKSIHKAGFAKYLAVPQFNNQYIFFDEKLEVKFNNQKLIENDILEAIENNQFEVYYQPKINLNDKKIMGAEALIRWQHPLRGMISPIEFIPVAENNGSIMRITEYVMERVCYDLAKWINEDKSVVPIAINLSQLELYNKSTLDNLNHYIHKYNIPPNLLEIEITERVALENLSTAKKAIKAFKKLGLTVAMDDFGAGYASTNYIKHLPFDTIKIDKSLIDGIEQSNKSELLLKGMVGIIQDLGFIVVAEGVENTLQVEKLEEMQVECAQGYVFARPMDCKAFEEHLV